MSQTLVSLPHCLWYHSLHLRHCSQSSSGGSLKSSLHYMQRYCLAVLDFMFFSCLGNGSFLFFFFCLRHVTFFLLQLLALGCCRLSWCALWFVCTSNFRLTFWHRWFPCFLLFHYQFLFIGVDISTSMFTTGPV